MFGNYDIEILTKLANSVYSPTSAKKEDQNRNSIYNTKLRINLNLAKVRLEDLMMGRVELDSTYT